MGVEKSIDLKVPLGPSINVAYSNSGKKRVKSVDYKIYELKIKEFFRQLPEDYKITGDNWLGVKYIFYFNIYNQDGTKKKKDTFNYEKVLTDVLSHYIKGFNDHKIKRGFVEKIDNTTGEEDFVLVSIYEID